MTSNFDLNSTQQKAENAAKREEARLKKQRQRARYAEQDAIDALMATDPDNFPAAQQAIWARNKTKLTTQELTELEACQAEFIGLFQDVEDVITYLPKGRKIGPPDLPYVDTLFQECQPFVLPIDPTQRLVFHISPEEFCDLHRNVNSQPFKHFTTSVDREWFLFGYYTRFQTYLWNEFVDILARYIQTHPEDQDLEKDLCDKIIAEYQKRQPRHRPETTHHNLRESEQREEYDRISAVRLEKEIADARKSLLDPFNQSNYQF